VPDWSAYVEYNAPDVTPEVYERISDHLAHGDTPSTAPNGNLSVYLQVTAPTAEAATAEALRAAGHAVTTAYGQTTVLGIEVMTTAERDRRNTAPVDVPELSGIAELAEMLGCTGQRASQITKTARFRQHVQTVATLAAGPVFLAAQLRQFAKLPRPAGRPPKATTES
jgi:hypothetical protein